MFCRLLLCIFLVIFADLGAAQERTESSVIGLHIVFKGTAIKDIEKRDRLHKLLGFEVAFRSKQQHLDFVKFVDPKTPGRFYERSCEVYLLADFVESCIPEKAQPLPASVCDFDKSVKESCETSSYTDPLASLIWLMPEVCRNWITGCLNKQGSPYSSLWAQHQVGSDLVKKDIAELRKQGKKFGSVKVGIIDSDFSEDWLKSYLKYSPKSLLPWDRTDGHGAKVISLIAGKSEVSGSSVAKIASIADAFGGSMTGALEKTGEMNLDLVNVSMSFCTNLLFNGAQTCALPAFADLNDAAAVKLVEKSVLVMAAGNHQTGGGQKTPHENVIVVGSSTMTGMPSSFSNRARDVTILAPSNNEILAMDKTGLTQFGGTSGAAPLVTAALADVFGVLGRLSGKDVKTLLAKTATHLPSNDLDPGYNGAGLLNHYKLFRVAQRLKEKGFPADRKALNDPKTFDFADEARGYIESAKKLLRGEKCSDVELARDQLRKAFLLGGSKDSRDWLSTMYESAGFGYEANFYGTENGDELLRLHVEGVPGDSGTLKLIGAGGLSTAEKLTQLRAAQAQKKKEYDEIERLQKSVLLNFKPTYVSEDLKKLREDEKFYRDHVRKTELGTVEQIFGSAKKDLRDLQQQRADCTGKLIRYVEKNSTRARKDVIGAAKVFSSFMSSGQCDLSSDEMGHLIQDTHFKEAAEFERNGTLEKMIFLSREKLKDYRQKYPHLPLLDGK